ncbi:hypothetical protein OHA72_27705 [Dactylosporangium sp. NBC_01737]|uniref:hypothetical protein n=1 Tax=Dactylosporangium sp. NBC_01737 TaxID=2975959 RepID=UPI002E11D3F5|nr:hypothetical protein OHA72_27705 [Dactylosporangium sp. NBC_01737]
MSTVAVALLLVASMLAVGTALTVADFRALGRSRSVLLVSVAVNVVLVPALTVMLGRLAGLGQDAMLGVVLAAAAPGGGTGALLTLYARGDLAVSAALKGIHAPLGLVSVPVWAAAGHDVIPADAGGLALVAGGLLGQLVPLGAGMLLLRRRPGAARRVHGIARRCADLLLVGLVAYFVVTGAGRLPEAGWAAVGVIAVVVAGCLASSQVPWLGPGPTRRAVAMTTAVRNLSLALFVASTASTVVVLALLAYGLSVPVAVLLARPAPPSA